MNKVIAGSSLLLIAAAFAVKTTASASPAATQNWVRNYVSTNTSASASYTNSVEMSQRLASNVNRTMMQALYEGDTNAVEKAIEAGRVEAKRIAAIALAGSNNL